MDKRKVIGVTW